MEEYRSYLGVIGDQDNFVLRAGCENVGENYSQCGQLSRVLWIHCLRGGLLLVLVHKP